MTAMTPMTHRRSKGVGAFIASCLLLLCACTRGSKEAAASDRAAAPAPGAAAPAPCYDTASALPCPQEFTDAGERRLPTSGALCSLGPCKACGSATVPSYRDAAGFARAGWCACVTRSDDSGLSTYTCFSAATSPAPRP